MSYFVDTHCHLDLFKEIEKNSKAEDSSGIKTITVTNAPSFFIPNTSLFEGMTNIRVALGFHPQLVEQYQHEQTIFEHLLDKTRYVGEIGLDGSADLKSTYSLQKIILQRILRTIRDKNDKILTVHSRNAASETIEVLTRYLKNTHCKVILHWYSGDSSALKTAILKGYFFSINHKMTESKKGQEIISQIPENLLLTETDSPFSFSGIIKNRTDSLHKTISFLAALKHIGTEEAKNLIYSNFKSVLS